MKARTPDAPDQALDGAATESMLQLTGSLVKTGAKGRRCRTRKPPKISGAVRGAEQLRAQFDLVVASDTGAFFSAFPVTHAELNKLRSCLRSLNAAPLTLDWILARADEHRAAHGEWPYPTSGPIDGTDESWRAVDTALRMGGRGLPGGTTLVKLLAKHRDVKRRTKGSVKRPLTVEWVIAKADEYQEAHGKRPAGRSGPIEGAGGLTWNAVDQALTRGVRGFPGGSSLHKLLKRYGRI